MILDVEIDYNSLIQCLKQPSVNDLFGNINNNNTS